MGGMEGVNEGFNSSKSGLGERKRKNGPENTGLAEKNAKKQPRRNDP